MTNLWVDLPVARQEHNPDTDIIVRQSTIGSMQLCEMRVGYRGADGYLEPVSEAMAFGTCVHHLIAEDLLSGEEQLDLITNMKEWVETILVEQYDWTIDKVPDAHHFFSELGVAYRTWRKQIHPLLDGEKLLRAEETMLLPLGPSQSGTIFLQGTPDVVFDTHIRDTKTAGRGWKQAKADTSIQATLYMALAKQDLNRSLRSFAFDVYDRSKSHWDVYPVRRTIPQINAALKTAYNYGLKLEAGIYTATPVPASSFDNRRGWYCQPKFCSAWNICEYKYIGDDRKESEFAERKWS